MTPDSPVELDVVPKAHHRWMVWPALGLVAAGCGNSEGSQILVATVVAFEDALWSGDVDTALALVTEDFTYRHPEEPISDPEELRHLFGGDEDHAHETEIRVVSTSHEVEGNVVTWNSVRYWPESFGDSVSLRATFDGELISEVAETGALTTATDAIGCEDSYAYSWHADYMADAVGTSTDPVTAATEAFPEAAEGVVLEEAAAGTEPISGGHGPVVRASQDGYTVGFVFLSPSSDGTLLVNGVTACEGYLEPGFADEEHGDEEITEG